MRLGKSKVSHVPLLEGNLDGRAIKRTGGLTQWKTLACAL